MTLKSQKIKRPILRYHGGKWALSSWIISNFPRHDIYVEPFCGAASVLLTKSRARAEVLNDKHQRIVSAFKVLRDPKKSKKLQELLRLTPCSEIEYVSARDRHPDPIEDARRLIVLGHQSHGSTGSTGGKLSGWRRGVRARGQSSAMEWASLWASVAAWSDRLRGVYLECTDAISLITRWDNPETLFYVDPPYVASTRSTGLGAYAHEMTDMDHRLLAKALKSVKGKVVLSGYACGLYDDELYSDWRRIQRKAITDQARSVTEVLWMNFEVESYRQRDLFEVV